MHYLDGVNTDEKVLGSLKMYRGADCVDKFVGHIEDEIQRQSLLIYWKEEKKKKQYVITVIKELMTCE